MTIRIEILSRSNNKINSAMYYEIPADIYSPESVDNSRSPAGVGLSPSELKDLKDGRLVEVLDSTTVGNRPISELQTALERVWENGKDSTIQQYNNDYTYIGQIWDGTWR